MVVAGRVAAVAAANRKKQQKKLKKLEAKAAQEQAAIEKWFAAYDVNRDGTLSMDEMRKLLTDVKRKVTGDAEAVVSEDLLKQVVDHSKSSDGAVHGANLLKAIKKYKSLLRETTELRELFVRHDVNESGKLESEQLLALLNEVYAPEVATEADVEFIFAQCDKNQNGGIDPDELAPAIASWLDIAKDLPPDDGKGGSSMCTVL